MLGCFGDSYESVINCTRVFHMHSEFLVCVIKISQNMSFTFILAVLQTGILLFPMWKYISLSFNVTGNSVKCSVFSYKLFKIQNRFSFY